MRFGIVTTLAQRMWKVLNLAITGIACAAVFIMVFMVVIGVIARYVFNRPLPFSDEYPAYLLVAVVFLGLTYTHKTGGHIAINVLTNRLTGNFGNWLGLVTLAVAFFYVIVLAVQTADVAILSLETGRRSHQLMLTPLGPIQALMPVGLGLFAISIMIELITKIRSLLHK